MIKIELSKLHRCETKQWLLLLPKGAEVFINADSYLLAQSAAFAYKSSALMGKKVIRYGLKFPTKTVWIQARVNEPSSRFKKNALCLKVKRSLFSFFWREKNIPLLTIDSDLFSPSLFKWDPGEDFETKLKKNPFEDPFTRLAADYFQTLDKPFKPTVSFNNSYALAYENGILKLQQRKKISKKTNRVTLKLYLEFIHELFGKERLETTQFRFNFDLQHMIQKGDPLTPEHVYRVNIGMNNLEMRELELLYGRILQLKNYEDKLPSDLKLLSKFLFTRFHFSLRELRQLKTLLDEQSLQTYLKNIFGSEPPPKHVYQLPLEAFTFVIKLLLTPLAYFDLAFTGKKIVHKAIMGYYTIGGRKRFKPWLDLQELLQTFISMQKPNDWLNFYELLSHIVSKKHLIRRHPSLNWCVGALIPGPKTSEGETRWYFINSWTDNNQGDFNYTLVPAFERPEKAMSVKLYRSTASDQYQMFGWNSLGADLSTSGAPGGGKHEKADEHELPFFLKRTIPLWEAYYLTALKSMSNHIKPSREILTQVLNQLQVAVYYVPKEHQSSFRSLSETSTASKELLELQKLYDQLCSKFNDLGHKLQELPEYKIDSDVAFVGHSLGGALSQACLHHFCTFYNRIPMPGCKFICYCSDAPGITNGEADSFWSFLNLHHDVIQTLNKKWHIITQFEYGDLIPQSGSAHLAGFQKPVLDLVEMTNSLFKPLAVATAKTITTPPTHGRRIGEALKGKDFQLFSISQKEIYALDHSFWLSPKISKLFGFKVLKSPRIFEGLRRLVGYTFDPFKGIAKALWHRLRRPRGAVLRDNEGCAHIAYESPLAELVRPRPSTSKETV